MMARTCLLVAACSVSLQAQVTFDRILQAVNASRRTG